MRNVLMIAFNFPPLAQSTGRFRTLSFARHLPSHGWRPTVLTADERAYEAVQPTSLREVPEGLNVVRAPGLDVGRHLALRGRYPRWLATPDRWNTWAIGAAIRGVRWVREHRPDALWVTYPVPSALLAATWIQRRTGLPLVVDLRDPVVYENWPVDRWRRAVFSRLERRAVEVASAVVCTTPSACALYRERYAHLPAQRFHTIANGVEDAMLATVASTTSASSPHTVTLVHGGLMEVPERDPTALFNALRQLAQASPAVAARLRIVLRGSGREEALKRQVAALGLESRVSIAGPIAHQDALAEMRSADALLLFQGRECNRQIPAKAYEYLACQRPIVGLIDAHGDTRALVAGEWGVPYVANMDDPIAIADVLARLVNDCEARHAHIPPATLVAQHSRSARTADLAALFNAIVNRAT
ncbi:MAG TPA: glycosyltransferase [Burkholderiaceae bacterium]|nr:glycosyltransferase [Burkholderiaceae bacterium]